MLQLGSVSNLERGERLNQMFQYLSLGSHWGAEPPLSGPNLSALHPTTSEEFEFDWENCDELGRAHFKFSKSLLH